MPTAEELRIMQAYPLDLKVKKTQLRIREWVNYYGAENCAVSFSGGKDSTVLLHIVRELYPDIEAVFADTQLEYPEYPRILEGDTIFCLRTDSVDSGDIAVVIYDGEDATVKKVNYVPGEDWLELIPFNPEYPVKRIEGSDLELCRVQGKVVKLIRDV